jgi:Cu(I)/Ag(I) efflux system membrane fusion protein
VTDAKTHEPHEPHEHGHEPLPEGAEAPPPGTRVMAVVRWLLVAAMAGAALFSVGHGLGWFAPAAAHAHVRYHCPMHPQIVSDHPGECPICHMTLEPMPEAHAAAGAAPAGATAVPGLAPVTLTADRIQLTGLRTAKVTRKPMGGDLRTIGTIAASERNLAVVSPRFEGWIETLAVSETGRRVKQGQVLATLYSPEVLAAQQELLNARTWTTGAGAFGTKPPADLETAARRRLELLGLGKADIDAVLASGQASRTVSLRAPRAGHVIRKTAVQGGHVEPGTPLFEIADLSTVWLLTEVYEQDAARVHVGQEAVWTTGGFAGERWKGTVTFVQPTVDAASRTLEVRVELANADGRLRPGMYGDVTLAAPAADALAVPAEAVVDTGDRRYVFVAQEGGRFEPRVVELGGRAGGDVQVLTGLREGEVVVTTGNFLIDSESRLGAALASEPGK